MTLDEVIETLKRFPEDFVFELGFHRPHSYRGYYDQLAFEPKENVIAFHMLEDAIRANGSMFEGYKGGKYLMSGNTDCHLAEYGCCGEPLSTYFFEANGQSEEITRLRSKLEEAKEIIQATIDYLDCDWFPHTSRNGNDRATVRSRARSFLRENPNG